MSEGWYKIELTDDLRTRPLPDAIFQVRHEFLQRYDTTLNKPSGALLLANFELDRPEQVLPSVLYYYLSAPGVRLLQHLLYQYGARPCAEPSVADTHFIVGERDYFWSLQTDNGQLRKAKSP